MIRQSIWRGLLYSAIAASALAGAPAQAWSLEPMYERYYYSDASHTTQVGYERDTCNYYGVGGSATDGYETPYMESYVIGYCDHGIEYPI